MGEAWKRNVNNEAISAVKAKNNDDLKLASPLKMESRQIWDRFWEGKMALIDIMYKKRKNEKDDWTILFGETVRRALSWKSLAYTCYILLLE